MSGRRPGRPAGPAGQLGRNTRPQAAQGVWADHEHGAREAHDDTGPLMPPLTRSRREGAAWRQRWRTSSGSCSGCPALPSGQGALNPVSLGMKENVRVAQQDRARDSLLEIGRRDRKRRGGSAQSRGKLRPLAPCRSRAKPGANREGVETGWVAPKGSGLRGPGLG
jgi:hypothetical protein